MLQLVLFVCECRGGGWGVVEVRLGVGCPYPPIRNDIVILRHLLKINSYALSVVVLKIV